MKPSRVALLPICSHDFAHWARVDRALSLKGGSGAIAVAVGRCRLCGPGLVRQTVEGTVTRGAVEERGEHRVQDLRDMDSGVVSHGPNGNASDVPHSTISDSENTPKGG